MPRHVLTLLAGLALAVLLWRGAGVFAEHVEDEPLALDELRAFTEIVATIVGRRQRPEGDRRVRPRGEFAGAR